MKISLFKAAWEGRLKTAFSMFLRLGLFLCVSQKFGRIGRHGQTVHLSAVYITKIEPGPAF